MLTNSNGDVHLVSGPAGEITVVAHKHTVAGSEEQIHVDYHQSSDGNTLIVSYTPSSGFTIGLFGRIGVDFEVTVPSQTALNVQNSNGLIDANGITGQITLNSSNGRVSTNGGSGQITLITSNGSIQADNASGTVRLKTENGSITVSGVSASGNSTFETSNGSIGYSGSLDRSGTYLFHTSNGSIDLTLAADANFQVTSSTSNGGVTSDFGVTSGTVGTAPYAQVTLETSNGSISIHRAGGRLTGRDLG
jgi:hypothetical protein